MLAEQTYLEGLILVEQQGRAISLVGYLHQVFAGIYYQQNRLEEAINALERAQHFMQDWEQVDLRINGWIFVALLQLKSNDLETAHRILQETEHMVLHQGNKEWESTMTVQRVWYWLAAGELQAASTWAKHVDFSAAWHPARKDEVLMWVRVHLAQQQYQDAVKILERFNGALDQPGDIAGMLRFLALLAVALEQADERRRAQETVVRLLSMSEHEGYVRLFLDEGEPMRRLLQRFLDAFAADEQVHRGCRVHFSRGSWQRSSRRSRGVV
ncbi:hypothetical protein KSD_58000 [Ktedonobacter sp. SOSP1-85]|uniref:hypothetical protein n=1 Tax=Ktedonobacter sp. SOSP1-85 TaxID=2778367 RepID=UPI00191569CC|nr:hypothetical protein [Ktedonobacter sp. SOSP1-85]GHO78029.1 hypothetical protein KSD_58000 [Ktedonobacter sp. SOSP1-85]